MPNPGPRSGALSVVVVFNASATTGQPAIPQKALRALTRVFDPDDEFALIGFDAGPRLAVGFTRNVDDIQNRLTPAASSDRGRLLDGVRLALDESHAARNPRRAIVIVSNGGGDAPLYDETETKAVAAAADVPIYSLSVSPDGATSALLDGLAQQTAGQHFKIGAVEIAKTSDMATKIAVALRQFYVLRFQSTNTARDGAYRTIGVELLPPHGISSLRTDARSGYYPPSR